MRSLLFILLASSIIGFFGPIHAGHAQTGLLPHAPILITSLGGVENFSSTDSGVTSGTGTPIDPYIISGWEIVTNSSSGIHVRSTRSFFIIRNVFVRGTGSQGLSQGIFFEGVQNGRVNKANITGFTYGVQISLGFGNVVENSNIWENMDGIYLQGSNHLVRNNNLYNNTEYGAAVTSSTFNSFENNNSSDNGNMINGAGFFITGSNNVFDNNIVIGNSWFGIKMVGSAGLASSNNVFSKNTISVNGGTPDGGGICRCDGGGLVFANNATANLIVGNYVSDQDNGIGLEIDAVGDFRNNVTMNTVVRNRFGLYVISSSQNIIYNNYLNNTTNVFDNTLQNSWNITKTLRTNILGGPFQGGNFYSDYTGRDLDGDGIGDTPYSTSNSPELDPLPLTQNQPAIVHDIAALSVVASTSSAHCGANIAIVSKVSNQGSVTQSFNVTLSYNGTTITTRELVNIPAFSTTTFTTAWDTPGICSGTYILEATATTVTGETYTVNNISPPTSIHLTMNLSPVADFAIDNSSPSADDNVRLNATSSYDPDGTITAYSWNFGDGTVGTGQAITHVWTLAGSYAVTLTVTDNDGFTSSHEQIINAASKLPGTPQNFALSATSGRATLTWTAPSSSGGSAITEYLIYRAETPSGPWTNIANPTSNNYTDTTVADGRTYYYRVSAVNQAGIISQPTTSLNVLVPSGTMTSEGVLPDWLIITIAASLMAVTTVLVLFRNARKSRRLLI